MIHVHADQAKNIRNAVVKINKVENLRHTEQPGRGKKVNAELIRRCFGMLLGNCGLALGVCIFNKAALGNDPFSGMVMALSSALKLKYSLVLIVLNCFLFLFEIWKGRKMIGAGTIVNWFLIGYIVDFLNPLFGEAGQPESLGIRVLILISGLLVTSVSCSFYQMSKMGIAPYDSISLIADRDTKIPYFWCRMATDVLCVVVCFLAGGLLGIGTIICAFGLGPVISFSDKFISGPLIYSKKKLTK